MNDLPNKLNTDFLLGHYRIVSKLGAGGMGEVYLAQDTKLERRVALKILPAEFAEDRDRMKRFVREAQSASALNHPNIITIYEIGVSGDTHFIATEFIDGKTLTEYARAKSLDEKFVLEIAIQIASALDEAHQAGIVHRDIKPDNIMLRPNGLVKILDFGIAKSSVRTSTDEEAATAIQAQTQAGMIIGTPNYMSPEQARGQQIDHQTDIFSFGVVLYEMLSGASPFAGETVSDVIAAVLTKEPPRLTNVPPELAAILDKTLQKDKRNRYKSAKDLLRDLKEVKEELAINSRLGRNSAPNLDEPETQILHAQTTSETEHQNSIAVLPFANMSADEENEYFCDGLAEELLNALAKIEDLRVAARTSAFSFKNKNTEVSLIGKTLNVKTILEGSVRRSGNRIRITVQLINASDGYHLWSERYDREMTDIFDVQDEITLAVVEALKLQLFGEEKNAVLKRYTDNTKAYELYLRGRFFWNKRTPEDFRKAIEYFEQAIRLDSGYALAFSGLADCYNFLAYYEAVSPREIAPKARAAALKALELDDSLAEAHASLGTYKTFFEFDWAGCKKELKRAIEINPNYTPAHHWYASILTIERRFDEAFDEGEKALKIEPLNPLVGGIVAWNFYQARRYEKAIETARKTLETAPDFFFPQWILGISYGQLKMYEKGVEHLRRAVSLGGGLAHLQAEYGRVLAEAARTGEARQILEDFETQAKSRYVSPVNTARIHIGLGENEQAMRQIEKAFEEHSVGLMWLGSDAAFDSLRGDSRFQDILRRAGLPTDINAQNKTLDETSEAQTAIFAPATTSGKEIPAAVVKTDGQTSQADQPKAKRKWRLFGLLGLIILAAGFFAYRYFAPNNSRQIESIAVMPFENASGNQDAEYLSDGMTETLIGSLSQLPNLNVKARSSVFRYKGKETDARTIGRELNVQAILTGRILQRGQDLILYVELVDAETENVLWNADYNRQMTNLVSLQTEIARDVSQKLKTKLSGADEQLLAKNYTENSEAYQLYLKGRYNFNKFSRDGFRKGIEFFNQAITADPNYALAYSGLADCYFGLSDQFEPPREVMPKARAAAERALQLDESLAEAHVSLGLVKMFHDWEWAEAERRFTRAIELDPNYGNAHFFYARYLAWTGRFDEAVTECERAVRIEPLSSTYNANLGYFLLLANRNDDAVGQLQKTIDLELSSYAARYYLALSYLKQGELKKAVSESENAAPPANREPRYVGALGFTYAAAGQPEKARRILEELNKIKEQQYVSSYYFAVVYSGLNEKDQAFAYLEKAYTERSDALTSIKVNPWFENLRSDTRFANLLRRMNLPQ